jgi:hypothetical protein
MLFTRKHDVNIPPLYMNDDVLEDVLKHKHLGIHFCPNGTWKDHINEIYNLTSEVPFRRPVTMLANSYCTDSIRSDCSLVQLSQTTLPYSSIGLIQPK